ncbi:hypothetical protein [Kitasatospora sp. LaBMicrA B282]|uniref:hypothetical protein n=1 Tax=Kitasatospora sp. LaBMicrA B282 TaxID=3420949 RepID=UPI003D0A3B6D
MLLARTAGGTLVCPTCGGAPATLRTLHHLGAPGRPEDAYSIDLESGEHFKGLESVCELADPYPPGDLLVLDVGCRHGCESTLHLTLQSWRTVGTLTARRGRGLSLLPQPPLERSLPSWEDLEAQASELYPKALALAGIPESDIHWQSRLPSAVHCVGTSPHGARCRRSQLNHVGEHCRSHAPAPITLLDQVVGHLGTIRSALRSGAMYGGEYWIRHVQNGLTDARDVLEQADTAPAPSTPAPAPPTPTTPVLLVKELGPAKFNGPCRGCLEPISKGDRYALVLTAGGARKRWMHEHCAHEAAAASRDQFGGQEDQP